MDVVAVGCDSRPKSRMPLEAKFLLITYRADLGGVFEDALGLLLCENAFRDS